jgi:hypothetical protein
MSDTQPDAELPTDPIFVDELPPNVRTGGTPAVWWDPCEKLKGRPGAWAIIRTGTSNQIRPMASNLRHRRVRFPEGNFEFEVRHDPAYPVDRDSRKALYARYVGPVEDAPAPDGE